MAYGTRFRMVFSGLRRTRCPRHVSGRMPAVARSFDTTATVRVDASWRSPRQFCNLHTRWPVSAKCMRFARPVVRILAKGVQRPQGEREVRGQATTECPSDYNRLVCDFHAILSTLTSLADQCPPARGLHDGLAVRNARFRRFASDRPVCMAFSHGASDLRPVHGSTAMGQSVS
jgi:hypothetical protein